MTKDKRDQAIVGLFVLVAAALVVGTVFALGAASGGKVKTFHTYFQFAAGVEPGTTVRYSGGPKVGRVEKVAIDPGDPSRIEVTFTVDEDLPVKTDSRVKIMTLTPLGDNHVEVLPGTPGAGVAPNGTFLPSEPYADFGAVIQQLQDIAPHAQELIVTLNARVVELKDTLSRVNDMLSPENRANFSAVLAGARGTIQENRPALKSTLDNLNQASGRVQPVLDDLRKTAAQADQTLDHVDAMIGEDRPDIHQSVIELREALASVTSLTGKLNQTVDVNSENLDEVLDNLRSVTENLKEITDTIKARPYLLIRSSPPAEHKPGDSR
jgi:phospholipid/cholesterol/gamma-HCH transport system substrate-binding protein